MLRDRSLRGRKALLAILLVLAACGESSGHAQSGLGAQLPAVALIGLRDGVPTSTSDLRGTSLVINFWATWCRPCRDEMPALERLSHRLSAHGVQVIGITLDQDLNLAREFVRDRELTFPIYADADKKALQSTLRIGALPETILLTPDGAIAARILGARDWNSAEGDRLLEQALNLRLAFGRARPG